MNSRSSRKCSQRGIWRRCFFLLRRTTNFLQSQASAFTCFASVCTLRSRYSLASLGCHRVIVTCMTTALKRQSSCMPWKYATQSLSLSLEDTAHLDLASRISWPRQDGFEQRLKHILELPTLLHIGMRESIGPLENRPDLANTCPDGGHLLPHLCKPSQRRHLAQSLRVRPPSKTLQSQKI